MIIGTPMGIAAEKAVYVRAARNMEYRAESERLAFWSEIAAQVILYRTREGISQAELAQRVGTSYSSISQLERGQHPTSLETLRRVAVALGRRNTTRLQDDERPSHVC
jgi:DNA-binding XRE family transcriptional regulator